VIRTQTAGRDHARENYTVTGSWILELRTRLNIGLHARAGRIGRAWEFD
jgi:hypothetical protein